MSASDYFISSNSIGHGSQRIRIEHAIGVVAGIVAALLMYKFTGFGGEVAFFAALLVMLVIWRSDPRWLFGAAIGSFGAIVIVSTMWRSVQLFDKPLSSRMTLWSFYFLVIGVMLLIVESYWPKDGTFNAMQQKAPSAAKNGRYKNLPAHIKSKLKHIREEKAAEAAANTFAVPATETGPFKHPVFANNQSTAGQQHGRQGSSGEPKPIAQRRPPEKPFQYIAQSPVKPRQNVQPRPALPVQLAHQAAPTQAVPHPTPARRPQHEWPHVLASAASSARTQPAKKPPQQPPAVQPGARRPAPKPKFSAPPLLDLRSAPRIAPGHSSMRVSVKSDSPLPSKRRKLVQL